MPDDVIEGVEGVRSIVAAAAVAQQEAPVGDGVAADPVLDAARALGKDESPGKISAVLRLLAQSRADKITVEGVLSVIKRQTGCGLPALRDAFKSALSEGKPPWTSRCATREDGSPIPDVRNAMIALQHAPELRDLLAYDEMLCDVILRSPVPRPDKGFHVPFSPRVLGDDDVTALLVWMQDAGFEGMTFDNVYRAARLRAKEKAFDPLLDYLNGLEWDNEERVDRWLPSYLGAPDDDYHRQVGTMFLVAMVARAYAKPPHGVNADYTIVLEGQQGSLKSSACRALTEPWFSDNLQSVKGKDASQHLRGKWLVELGELSALSKSQIEDIKRFLTTDVERYRPSYGRGDVHEVRRCLFVGSTNRRSYLSDHTGNRRFWPVAVGRIDLASLKRDRDQLWAEAVALYRGGREWWPDPGLGQILTDEQSKRYDGDPWEERIIEWLRARAMATVFDIAKSGLGFDTPKIGRADQNRIIAVLEHLNWTKGKRGPHGERYWYPPAKEPVTPAEPAPPVTLAPTTMFHVSTNPPDALQSQSDSRSVKYPLDFNAY